MEKEIYNNISFADAELVSYLYDVDSENLKVEIKACDDGLIKVEFIEVIGVISYSAKMISGFFEETETNIFFNEAVRKYYSSSVSKEIIESHPYHCFKAVDSDDSLVFEVICKSLKTQKVQ